MAKSCQEVLIGVGIGECAHDVHVYLYGDKRKLIPDVHEYPELWYLFRHIYHYYLHGPDGNSPPDGVTSRTPSPFKYIDIQVILMFISV